MTIGNINSANFQKPVKTNAKPAVEKNTAPAIKDEHKPLVPEPEIHGLKDYLKNMGTSAKLGALGGAIKTGEFVNGFMPSYDGLDHPGKHILCAIPPILAGAVGGVVGGGVGLAFGVFGKNIGTHMSEETLR